MKPRTLNKIDDLKTRKKNAAQLKHASTQSVTTKVYQIPQSHEKKVEKPIKKNKAKDMTGLVEIELTEIEYLYAKEMSEASLRRLNKAHIIDLHTRLGNPGK